MSAAWGQEYVLTLSCPEKPGIVHAISGFLVQHSANILASQQYGEAPDGRFFMRVHFAVPPGAGLSRLRDDFARVAEAHQMSWQLHDAASRVRTLVMASQIIDEVGAELIVLARYMQIISSELCQQFEGRMINIHHSFLPSFKGAKPYHQAHARGVKLVGATAHYVTPDLDEGPIIEQDVIRVDHTLPPERLAEAGRDVEAQVLARAVTWHAEHRVLLNDDRTVVFH
jgi:formyltetrahydrofolate deformylase